MLKRQDSIQTFFPGRVEYQSGARRGGDDAFSYKPLSHGCGGVIQSVNWGEKKGERERERERERESERERVHSLAFSVCKVYCDATLHRYITV